MLSFLTATVLAVTLIILLIIQPGALAQTNFDYTSEHRIRKNARGFVGGVYAMTNDPEANAIVVYARRRNGTLVLLDSALETEGKGGEFNLGGSADPLISSFSVISTDDYKFILAVNAGSSSVSVFRVRSDFSLRLVSTTKVPGVGPNSIAQAGELVYVASVDADGEFESALEHQGLLSGYKLTSCGSLLPISRSVRKLSFRPSAIKFSSDRRSLVVSDPFAGANAINRDGRVEELSVFRVNRRGLLSNRPVSSVGSTAFNNEEGRNLPGVIGFSILKKDGIQYVVAPEFRSTGPDGMPADGQVGSVSTWRLSKRGTLSPVQLDIFTGSNVTEGQFAPCWITFSRTRRSFWTSNTPSDSLSAFSFRDGMSTLANEVAATGQLPVDSSISLDGRFVYQLFSGSVGVFRVSRRGRGMRLRQIQNPMNVPTTPQGIVAL